MCKCGCGKPPTMSCNGFNYNCLSDEEKKEKGTRAAVASKNKQKRSAISSKIHKAAREVNQDKIDLDNWFRIKMASSAKVCENCGKSLEHYNINDWFGSQHHIIDKSAINGCPSVASNPYNHMVLGRWCCHPQWHTNYENASKMPCFAVAKIRFNVFKNDIAENERRKIPAVFTTLTGTEQKKIKWNQRLKK